MQGRRWGGLGRLVLGNWPGLTRFLLMHGAGEAGVWRYDEVEEFVAASRQPGSARAGEALHWQFVLHDIPGMILRRYGRVCGPIALHDGADAAQDALIAILKNLQGLPEPSFRPASSMHTQTMCVAA